MSWPGLFVRAVSTPQVDTVRYAGLPRWTANGIPITTMDAPDHILIVDDDAEIRSLLGDTCEERLRATAVADGKAMWPALDAGHFDLIVLDLMLPGDDGLTLCRKLRAQSDMPVIMLTARGEETDRIVGLEMGADDYLPKPFSPRELLARIKACCGARAACRPTCAPTTRASSASPAGCSTRRPRTWCRPTGVVTLAQRRRIPLLRIFLGHPNHVLTRDQLID